MRVTVVPGLYFKSYSRHTEARVPFETLALAGALESVEGVFTRLVDFNLRGDDVHVGDGAAIFPGLTLDQTFYTRAAAALEAQHARVFVFNISIHTNGNLFHAVRIAEALRTVRPSVLIVFCGLGPSSRHTDLLEAYPSIDVVLRGESEMTAIALTERLKDIDDEVDDQRWRAAALAAVASLDGVTYAGSSGSVVNPDRALVQNLDDLPFPSSAYYGEVIRRAAAQTRDLRYLSVEEHIHLEAGRGCPFSCTFCSNTYLWRRRYRLKSPARIIAEMRRYNEDYCARQFLLHQQLFTVNKAKTRAFCEALIESGLDVEWSCFTRSDCLDDELLTLMRRSGCNTVLIGVESGSQRIQDLIRKKTKVDQVAQDIDRVIAHDIKPQLSYIIGFPEETEEDLQATIDMYLRYKFAHGVESQIGLLVPAGGTQVLSDRAQELDFDGVQTTTWYTRFFDDDSYDEMRTRPLVFPHNHFVRTEHLTRDLLLFVKSFDLAASYLTKSCAYATVSGLLAMPLDAHRDYLAWRSATPPSQRWAARWNGTLAWDTSAASVVMDFAQFLVDCVAGRDDDPTLLADLVGFELNLSMLNLRVREENWDDLCVSTPDVPDDNPVTDPSQPVIFRTRHRRADLTRYVDSGLDPTLRPHRPAEQFNTLLADGPTSITLTEETVEEAFWPTADTRFPVFRQIEF